MQIVVITSVFSVSKSPECQSKPIEEDMPLLDTDQP